MSVAIVIPTSTGFIACADSREHVLCDDNDITGTFRDEDTVPKLWRSGPLCIATMGHVVAPGFNLKRFVEKW